MWGPKATEFDAASSYLPIEEKQLPRRPAAAFRAFGGGSTLCLGRKLATSEILIFVSTFLLQFNAEPTDEPWFLPKPSYVNLTNSVMPPPKELRVRITKREGIKKAAWVSA